MYLISPIMGVTKKVIDMFVTITLMFLLARRPQPWPSIQSNSVLAYSHFQSLCKH